MHRHTKDFCILGMTNEQSQKLKAARMRIHYKLKSGYVAPMFSRKKEITALSAHSLSSKAH